MDKELMKTFNKGIKIGERIADSLEKLVNEPLIQMEPPPPQCPHCGVVNPEIQVDSTEGRGKISEFVLEATCASCGRPMYALSANWLIQGSKSSLLAVVNQIKGNQNG